MATKKRKSNNPAGRPKKEPTVVLYKRVPAALLDDCKRAVDDVLNQVIHT